MTDSKTLHDKAEEDLIVKLENIQTHLNNADGNIEGLRSHLVQNDQKLPPQAFENAKASIGKCRSEVYNAKSNLDTVSEILNVRKASLELKEVVLRSKPRSAFVERMTWIATALFPAGGFSFVLAGGVNDASILVAGVVWAVAAVLMIASLGYLKIDDDERREYFKKEFGELQPEPRSPAERIS